MAEDKHKQGALGIKTHQRAGEGADLRRHCEVQRSTEEPLGSEEQESHQGGVPKVVSEKWWSGAGQLWNGKMRRKRQYLGLILSSFSVGRGQ